MPSLSTSYSNDIIDNKIKIGTIISIDVVGIDHPKWNIILDITDDKILIASVFINTEVFYKYLNNPEIEALQIPVNKELCSCLDHDSFIDCHDLKEREYCVYKDVLIKNSIRKIGEIPKELLNQVYENVRKSKVITKKQKKRYKNIFPEF